MRKELLFNIIEAKKKNNEAILVILDIFENIINKYSRKLNGADTRQDLYVFLINLINNIDTKLIINYEDKQILLYFSKSLKNEYIRLSKKNAKKSKNEIYMNNELLYDCNKIESNIEILDSIRILTIYEKEIIRLIFFDGYKVSDIAKKTGKSRQAINQVKNRALKKLKKEYLTS
ncbi:sigma factor-like helix-turn-helix DNA-binding protein [Clostridium cuniculi]|uniref:sigma factor-like helix-turn-helix DNA-binding protein n=1 Tax=Clostridium cuniculi TaxID=2548455 RepID=UPI0010554FF1|nr:sigma factor-like helix-turn-helix DNA-binding protein [Clostridium cuniculi]